MGSKPNNWETAAPGPHRLTLLNKTIHFLFCEAWEEFLAAVLFGLASAELRHGEGFQRQKMQVYPNVHAHVHSPLSRQNNNLSLAAVILGANEGTS